MVSNTFIDISFDENGEPQIGPDGDLLLSYGNESILQNIMFRLKTYIGDFILEPSCGASLEYFIGQPNSPETGETVEAFVNYSLTHDGFLSPLEYTLEVFPFDLNTLAVVVKLNTSGDQSQILTFLNLREGVVVVSLN